MTRISRRKTLAAFALGAGSAGIGTKASAGRGRPDQLRSRVHGRVLFPGDPAYDIERAAWNLHIDSTPRVIVAAETPHDVVEAVRYAAGERLPVAVQATGHGQAVEADDAVLVSTRAMNGVSIRSDRRTATVDAGTLWRSVIDRAAEHGLAPPSGSTSRIGAVGYLSGGGLPVLGRRYGYGVDHVRGLEIVTADGRLRRVSARRSPDLFWAARGGGGNFGIVTAAEVDLMAQPRFYGGNLAFPGADAHRILSAWLSWGREQAQEMSTSVLLIRYPDDPGVPEVVRGRFLVHLRVAFTGEAADGEALVRPLRELGPVLDTVAERPYTEIDEVHQDPEDPLPALELNSLMGELDERFVANLMSVAGPDVATPPNIVECRLLGGALARPPARPSAIGHRATPYSLLFAGIAPPDDVEPMLAVLRDAREAVSEWATGAAFPNFLGGSGHGDPERVRTAYEADDYARLTRIKATYDPDNLFRLNHNIPPVAAPVRQ